MSFMKTELISGDEAFADYFATDDFDKFCIRQQLRVIDRIDSIERMFHPEYGTYPPQYEMEVRK